MYNIESRIRSVGDELTLLASKIFKARQLVVQNLSVPLLILVALCSTTLSLAPNSTAGETVLGLTSVDIGDPSPRSEVSSSGSGSITVTAGGSDIWGNQDQFNFLYETVEGDFDVQVRVDSLRYIGNAWSKAGLMVREDLTPGSRNHNVVVDPLDGANAYEVNFREVQDGATAQWGYSPGVPYPDAWVRLQRVGDTLTAYRGTDGVNWEQIGQMTPSMPYPSIVRVGLCTCAAQGNGGNATEATTAEYRSFNLTATPVVHPFVAFASPQGGGARADAKVVIQVRDFVTQLNPDSIQLNLDGVVVKPAVSKAGDLTTIEYQPPRIFPPASTHTVDLQFADNASPPFLGSFSFSFAVASYVGPNGNSYEIVRAQGIRWADAKLAAEQRSLCGQPGHLVTITTPDEDAYLQSLILEAGLGGGGGEVWAGGFQLTDQATPNDGWMWVNNEGPIQGFNGGSTYANWYYGEPNDCCNTSSEDNEENFVGLGLFGYQGWNDNGDGHLYDIGGYAVEYERPAVSVDIKPGSFPNPIYLDAPGKLPVAILSSPNLNANTVDPLTVRFGRTGMEAAPVSYSLSDVNKDKIKDLVCQFNIADTWLMCGDTVGVLTATTYGGCPIRGSDAVQILRCEPYALSVQAMQDVHQLTDVYLTVSPLLADCPAPTVAQNVQLKSFDLLGRLQWSKTTQNVALASSLNASVADLQYSDLARSQKIKAQMEVKSCSGNTPTVVLHQEGVVLLRPDLRVESVNVPGSAFVGQVVNIFVSIRELNGDLGATATAVLMEGDNVLDWREGVAVSPFGWVDVFFATVFSDVGTHNLKVVVRDVDPRDYDTSNNEKSFTIEVAEQPAYHYASYNHYDFEYLNEWNYPFYYSGRTYQKGKSESLNETLYLPTLLAFPINVLVEITVDSNRKVTASLENLEADYFYDSGCYAYGSVSRQLGDNFYFYYYGYRDACWFPGYLYSYANLYKSAADYVYFSSYYYYYWGDVPPAEWSGTSKYGEFLDATTSLDVRFVLGNATATYGGTATMPVYRYPYDYSWNYEDPATGYYERGFNKGTNSYGYSSGYLTP